MKGKKIRSDLLDELPLIPWHGFVDSAVEYLENLDSFTIKAESSIEKLADSLKRKRSTIPCCAMRKRLGLRNSSNSVKK